MELGQIALLLVASYAATVAAAINVKAPRKFIYWAGLPGIISYAVYIFVLSHTNTFIATFIGSLIVSILGQYMARRFKTVVNVFYIPAFFLYVPGMAIYQTAEYFMENDLIGASTSFYQAIMTALAIGLAVFVVDSAMDTFRYHANRTIEQQK